MENSGILKAATPIRPWLWILRGAICGCLVFITLKALVPRTSDIRFPPHFSILWFLLEAPQQAILDDSGIDLPSHPLPNIVHALITFGAPLLLNATIGAAIGFICWAIFAAARKRQVGVLNAKEDTHRQQKWEKWSRSAAKGALIGGILNLALQAWSKSEPGESSIVGWTLGVFDQLTLGWLLTWRDSGLSWSLASLAVFVLTGAVAGCIYRIIIDLNSKKAAQLALDARP